MGTLILSRGGAVGFFALNSKLLSNTRLFAVVAKNEPLTFRRAFGPKKMPLGLIRNRLAFPPSATPSVPNRLEGLVPVTRVRIFSTLGGLTNKTERLSSTLNS
jgi:hypothetical protein